MLLPEKNLKNHSYSDAHFCLELGKAYNKNKDYTSAIEELNKAVQLGYDDAEVHLELGIAYREKRKYDLAIQELKFALNHNPSDSGIHFELGHLYSENKDYTPAIEQLSRAIELGYDNFEVHLELGRAYRAKEDLSKAIEALNNALGHNPSDGRIHLELGRVYVKKNDFDLALKELKKAQELGLDNEEVHLELGRIFRQRKDYAKAIEEFEAALKHNPSESIIHFELGDLYGESKDYTSAIEELSRAIELGYDNFEIHLELGRAYRDQGMEAQAKKEFQTALMLNPQNGEAYAELAWMYETKKEYKLAIEELRTALVKGFDKECIRQGLSRISHKQQVVEEFEKLIEADPHGAGTALATEYTFQEGYGSFIKKLEEVVKINPKNLQAHIELAWIYKRHKQYDLAIEEIKKIDEITSTDKGFLIEQARVHLYKKEYDLALRKFEKALQGTANFDTQEDNFKNEFIMTLKDLFPQEEGRLRALVRDLPIVHGLCNNWRYPAMTKAEGAILYLITRLLKPEIIVEAGTWMGTSTSYLAKGCHDNKIGKVITVDRQDDIGYAVPEYLMSYIEFHKGVGIKDALPEICNKETKIDMFFHDSENSYEILHWEIGQILPFIRKDGLIVVHDVLKFNDSPGSNVARFFNEIKDEVNCHFFNTEIGLGVIKDIERLKLKMRTRKVHNYLELAKIYRENKDYNSAIEELKTALKFNSKNGYIHFELGRMYQRQKNYDLSLKELNQAVKLGLDSGMVYFELGKTLRELRDFVSAKEALKKAVEFGLDGDRLHLELGRVYRDEGKEAQAKKEFQTALMLNPQNGEAYAELAWIYINAQEYALAEKELKEAIQRGFNQDDAYQILNKIKHNQQVVEKFEKTMDAEFKSVNHVGCITEYMFQVGYKEFVAKLKKITETNPMNLRAHIELAWIYSWHNHDDLAIKELKKISEITSLNKGFLTELTRIYLDKKKYDLAIEEFKKAMQNNFDNNNQDDNINEEFIVTLKDLFSDREEEIEDLIKNLPKIHYLYNWRYPGMTKAEGGILYLITRLLRPEVIVEAGTWIGTSTSYLAKGCFDNRKGKVITVDIKEDVGYAIPEELLPYIEFHKQTDIRDVIPKICNKEIKVDMFFHDSLNSSEVILWEIEQILPFINKDGLIIAHDVFNYNDSPGKDVARFFNEIKDEVNCHFFNTEKGLGVIKDIERLKLR